jgi:hypothetical protein
LSYEYTSFVDEKLSKKYILVMCDSIFENVINKKILYSNYANLKLDNAVYNTINLKFNENYINILKDIILREAYEIEYNFPNAGSKFIELFVNYYKSNFVHNNNINGFIEKELSNIDEFKVLEKIDLTNKTKEFESKVSKKIINLIIDNSTMNTSIFVEKTIQSKNFIKKTDRVSFKLEYDSRFFNSQKKWSSKNFKYILIDGFIQDVSEIHHLLTEANENKEDYVIICKGASEEVKHTIKLNLMRGTLNVFPICLDVNEENVNILNDIAACLDGNIVSALKGDTISKSVRNNLPYAKDIIISEKSFSIKCLNRDRLNRQKKYLQKKIDQMERTNPNFEYLIKRTKNLESEKITINISNKNQNNVMLDIDNFLKFLRNSKDGIALVKNKNKTKIYTVRELVIIFKKLKSTIKIFKNIGGIIKLEK